MPAGARPAPSSRTVGLLLSNLGLLRGGVETRAVALARGLAERGHRVTVVGGRCPGRSLPPDLAALPVRWIRPLCLPLGLAAWRPLARRFPGWPLTTQSRTFAAACRLSPEVRRLIRRSDLTMSFLPRETAFFSAWRQRYGRAHLSYSPGGGKRWLKRDRSTVRLANPSVAARMRDRLDFPFDGLFAPGVPDGWLETPFEVRDRALTTLFVGRLEGHKGIFRTLEIFARLAARHDGLRLAIGGDGPARAELRRRITAAGLTERVELLGWLEPEEVRAAMRRSDLLLLPTEYENFPLVLLEAQAVGLPFAASDIRGVRGYVHLEAPLLPVDAPEAWERRVEALLDDPAARRRLSQRGRAWASDYTWSRAVAAVEGHLEQALERCRGSRA